jgi:hypothetical protein
MDTLPWKLAPEHRDHNDARMLRLEGRRREGLPLTSKELRLVSNWIDLLREKNAVVTYEPKTRKGFYWVPKEDSDDDIVRRPGSSPS